MLKLESLHALQKILLFKDQSVFYSFYKEIGFWICLEMMNVYLQIWRLSKEKKVLCGIIDKTVVNVV